MMTSKIDEIKDRLAKATPGPWKAFKTTDGRKLLGIGDANAEGVFDVGFGVWRDGDERDANADLIANSPSDIQYLLDEVERLEQQIYELDEMVKHDRGALGDV